MAVDHAKTNRRLIAIIIFLALLAVVSLWLHGQLIDYWVATRPPMPVTEKGFLIRLESHGAIFYVDKSEQLLANVLRFGPLVYWALDLFFLVIWRLVTRKTGN